LRDAEIGNVNNVWVSPGSVCFTSKPRHELIVSGELRLDHFDRHGTLRPEMRGAIHRPHASLSEELLELVLVIECVHSGANL